MFSKEDIDLIRSSPSTYGKLAYVKEHWPKEFEEINQLDIKPWYKRLYNYIYPDHPTTCPVCGAPLKYRSFKDGYGMYCSVKCVAVSELTKQKVRDTCLRKYGVEYISQVEEFKDKAKETCLKHYGVKNALQSKEIREKGKKTLMEKYGSEYALQSKEIREKGKKTLMEKYGVGNYSKTNEFLQLMHDVRSKKVKSRYPEIIEVLGNEMWRIECPHPECNKCNEKYFDSHYQIYKNRKTYGSEVCTRILPYQPAFSTHELTIYKWLDDIGMQYETMVRNVISPYEIDIYIPDLKIAIEVNGCYWHSDEFKHRNYHVNKWQKCCDKGIRLLQIWEDWMVKYPDKCKNLIYTCINGSENVCSDFRIDYTDSLSAYNFLNIHSLTKHIHKNDKFVGCYMGSELIGIMSIQDNNNHVTADNLCCVKISQSLIYDEFSRWLLENYKNKDVQIHICNDICDKDPFVNNGFELLSANIHPNKWYIQKNKFVRTKRASKKKFKNKEYIIYDSGSSVLVHKS